MAFAACDGGTISFYESKDCFEAKCHNPYHGKCVLTRGPTQRARMQGIPLAMMAVWLQRGRDCATKQDHFSMVEEIEWDFGTRLAPRGALRESPDFAGLLAQERRDLEEGEAEEPAMA